MMNGSGVIPTAASSIITTNFQPPAPDECDAIAQAQVTAFQERFMATKLLEVTMDVLLELEEPPLDMNNRNETEAIAMEIVEGIQSWLIPAMAGCNVNMNAGQQQRNLVIHRESDSGLQLPRKLEIEPYVVVNGRVRVEILPAASSSCHQINFSPWLVPVAVLELFLQDEGRTGFLELGGLLDRYADPLKNGAIALVGFLRLPTPKFKELIISVDVQA